jgi:hypothetical protein
VRTEEPLGMRRKNPPGLSDYPILVMDDEVKVADEVSKDGEKILQA